MYIRTRLFLYFLVCYSLVASFLHATVDNTRPDTNAKDSTATATNSPTAGDTLMSDGTNNYWDVAAAAGGGSGFPLSNDVSFASFGASEVGFMQYSTGAIPAAVSNAIIVYYVDVGGGEIQKQEVSWIATNFPQTNISIRQQ